MAAPSLVNTGSPASTAFGNNLTPALPGSRVNGNLLVLTAWTTLAPSGGSSNIASGGWTKLGDFADSGSNALLSIWYRVVTGTESDPTITLSGSTSWAAVIHQFTNVYADDPFGFADSVVARTTSSPLEMDGFAPTREESLGLAFLFSGSGTAAPAEPDDYDTLYLEENTTPAGRAGSARFVGYGFPDVGPSPDIEAAFSVSGHGFRFELCSQAEPEEPSEIIVPAVYDFDNPGSDDFQVPPYYKLIVEAWGAAASGGLYRGAGKLGNPGGDTVVPTFGMVARGGEAATSEFANEFHWNTTRPGRGGTAEGGNAANIRGGDGEAGGRTTTVQGKGKGGDSPFGGAGGPRGTGTTNGADGQHPGGGGAGSQRSSTGLAGTWEIGTTTMSGPGGAAGGYSRSEFYRTDSDAPDVGSLIEFEIGEGGAAEEGSDGDPDSGKGANGRVRITILGEPPSEPNNDGAGTATISGTPRVGEVLTCVFNNDDPDGTAAPESIMFQWRRNDTPIDGAIGPTYELQAADAAAMVACGVTYTDGQGFFESIVSDAVGPVEPPPKPLDYFYETPHGGAATIFAAYGQRQLVSDYTGPLLRLRAGSLEGEEQDFYPLPNGELDWDAIEDWRGETDEFTTVRVVTWYDQSGNGRHLGQAQAVGNMPRFANGFSQPLTVPSGRRSFHFNGNEAFRRDDVNGPNEALAFLAVVKRDSGNPGPVFSFEWPDGTEGTTDTAFLISTEAAQDYDANAVVFVGHGLNAGNAPRAIKNGNFAESDTDDVVIWDGELSAKRVGLRWNSQPLNLSVKNHTQFHAIPNSTLHVGPRIFETGFESFVTELVLFAEDVRDSITGYRQDAALYWKTFEGEEELSEYVSEEDSEGENIPSEAPSEAEPESETQDGESESEAASERESESEAASERESESEAVSESESESEKAAVPPPIQVVVLTQ